MKRSYHYHTVHLHDTTTTHILHHTTTTTPNNIHHKHNQTNTIKPQHTIISTPDIAIALHPIPLLFHKEIKLAIMNFLLQRGNQLRHLTIECASAAVHRTPQIHCTSQIHQDDTLHVVTFNLNFIHVF